MISHKYRYLFVELPFTGSTAIHRELCDLYQGNAIIRKHATYPEFLQTATADEQEYFVFSSIRNPLDVAVSIYFKQKTNHRGNFTTPKKQRRFGGFVTKRALRRYNYIHDTNADFAPYFCRYYRVPYDNWSRLNHHSFDFIIRFEQLQDDFSRVLRLLGINQIRALPSKNPTKDKLEDFAFYYTPGTHDRARKVFGPFMEKWDYQFPSDWGDMPAPWFSTLSFNFLGFWRKLYWQYVKHNAFLLKLQGLPKKENQQYGV